MQTRCGWDGLIWVWYKSLIYHPLYNPFHPLNFCFNHTVMPCSSNGFVKLQYGCGGSELGRKLSSPFRWGGPLPICWALPKGSCGFGLMALVCRAESEFVLWKKERKRKARSVSHQKKKHSWAEPFPHDPLPSLTAFIKQLHMTVLSRALHCTPVLLSALHPLSGLTFKPFSGDV